MHLLQMRAPIYSTKGNSSTLPKITYVSPLTFNLSCLENLDFIETLFYKMRLAKFNTFVRFRCHLCSVDRVNEKGKLRLGLHASIILEQICSRAGSHKSLCFLSQCSVATHGYYPSLYLIIKGGLFPWSNTFLDSFTLPLNRIIHENTYRSVPFLLFPPNEREPSACGLSRPAHPAELERNVSDQESMSACLLKPRVE
jgi:hypothetical protein